MYGKKRIAITKDRQVVLAGNKSWIPIGRYNLEEGFLVGRLRKPDSWELSLNNENSFEFKFSSLKLLREFTVKQYSERLNQLS